MTRKSNAAALARFLSASGARVIDREREVSTDRTFSLTEREQTLVMAALQRHWESTTKDGAGLIETSASREVSDLMDRLHAEGIASFVGPDANRPR